MKFDIPFDFLIDHINDNDFSDLESLPLQIKTYILNHKNLFLNIVQCLSRTKLEKAVLYKIRSEETKNFHLEVKNRKIRRKLRISHLNVPQRFILQYVKLKCNVVISAPTGCGKTLMAMLFMMEIFGYDVREGVNESEIDNKDTNKTENNNIREQIHTQSNKSIPVNIKPQKNININDRELISRSEMKMPIVVYLAPQKALTTQIYNTISRCFSETLLLTSDSPISFRPCSILVTTPERYLLLLIRLNLRPRMLIIDEIHGLGTNRGQALEMIISITKCLDMYPNTLDEKAHSYQTRIIALSATIPNIDDIAEYINAKPIYFDDSFRPIQLSKYLIVVDPEELKKPISKNCKNKCKKNQHTRPDTSNLKYEERAKKLDNVENLSFKETSTSFGTYSSDYQKKSKDSNYDSKLYTLQKNTTPMQYDLFEPRTLFPIIQPFLEHEGKTILFIRSRKNVELFCKLFKEMDHMERDDVSRIEDGDTLFLYHHAELSLLERRAIEQKFIETKKRAILFSTATLAWGVDLPIDTVFVLDEFEDIDIVQMMGRAGRRVYQKIQDDSDELYTEHDTAIKSIQNTEKCTPNNLIEQSAYLITRDKRKLEFILALKPLTSQVESIKEFMLLSLWMQHDLIGRSFWWYEKNKPLKQKSLNLDPLRNSSTVLKTKIAQNFHDFDDCSSKSNESEPFHPHNLAKYSQDAYDSLINHHLIVGDRHFFHSDFLDNKIHIDIAEYVYGEPILICPSIPAIIITIYQIPVDITLFYRQRLNSITRTEQLINIIDDENITTDIKRNLLIYKMDGVSNAILRNILRHVWCIFHLYCFYDDCSGAKITLELIKNLEKNNTQNTYGHTSRNFSDSITGLNLITRQKQILPDTQSQSTQIYTVLPFIPFNILPKGTFQINTETYQSSNIDGLEEAQSYELELKPTGKKCVVIILTNKFSHFCSNHALATHLPDSVTADQLKFIKQDSNKGSVRSPENSSSSVTRICVTKIKYEQVMDDFRSAIYLIGTIYFDENGDYRLFGLEDLFLLNRKTIAVVGNGFDYNNCRIEASE